MSRSLLFMGEWGNGYRKQCQKEGNTPITITISFQMLTSLSTIIFSIYPAYRIRILWIMISQPMHCGFSCLLHIGKWTIPLHWYRQLNTNRPVFDPWLAFKLVFMPIRFRNFRNCKCKWRNHFRNVCAEFKNLMVIGG